MNGGSEIAQLKQQIELECQAMHLALHGYAIVSNHDAINHKYDAIGQHISQLEPLVGAEQATLIALGIYEKAMEP